MYGPEVKLSCPYHPREWQATANDLFNLEGGKNRSIVEIDDEETRQDLPGAWRRAKTSGLENYKELNGFKEESSDLADNYVKTQRVAELLLQLSDALAEQGINGFAELANFDYVTVDDTARKTGMSEKDGILAGEENIKPASRGQTSRVEEEEETSDEEVETSDEEKDKESLLPDINTPLGNYGTID